MPTNLPDITGATTQPGVPSVDESTLQQLADRLGDVVQNFYNWLGEAKIPRMAELLTDLEHMPLFGAIGLLLVGLACLFFGWRVFRVLIAVNAAALGAVLGGLLAIRLGGDGYTLLGMGIGALLLAIISLPLVRLFVALFGGAAGAMLGGGAFKYLMVMIGAPDMVPFYWVGVVVGAGLMAILALALFHLAVMVVMAMQGAGLVLSGAIALLLKLPQTGPQVYDWAKANPPILLLMVIGISIAGLTVQLTGTSRRTRQQQQQSTTPAEQT